MSLRKSLREYISTRRSERPAWLRETIIQVALVFVGVLTVVFSDESTMRQNGRLSWLGINGLKAVISLCMIGIVT
jgi:hypothetical protein